MEEGLSAGVCARSGGRWLSEAQPATCNATKQVHTVADEEGKERRRRKEKTPCLCVKAPPPFEKKVKPSSSLGPADGLDWRRRECFHPMWFSPLSFSLPAFHVAPIRTCKQCGFQQISPNKHTAIAFSAIAPVSGARG